MITATVTIGFTAVDDWNDDRVNERHLVGRLATIGGRISRVIIDIGPARYPLLDPSLVRQHLPKGIDVEVTGERADVVLGIMQQLDPQPTTDCRNCVDWLPCPDHQAATS